MASLPHDKVKRGLLPVWGGFPHGLCRPRQWENFHGMYYLCAIPLVSMLHHKNMGGLLPAWGGLPHGLCRPRQRACPFGLHFVIEVLPYTPLGQRGGGANLLPTPCKWASFTMLYTVQTTQLVRGSAVWRTRAGAVSILRLQVCMFPGRRWTAHTHGLAWPSYYLKAVAVFTKAPALDISYT